MAHELPYDDPERLRARLRTRYPIAVDRAIGLGRLPNVRLQRALAGLPRVGLLDRGLTWVHWLWFLEPYCGLLYILLRHPRALPARGAAARRGLRHRLRRLLRGAHRAALVVLRGGPDRRRGAADHGGGRRGLLGLRLAAHVRGPGRQPLGGDALAPLRHLAGRRRRAGRGGQGRGRRRLGLRADPRLRPRLPRRALRHRPRRRAPPSSPSSARASRSPSPSSTGSIAACSAWSAWRTGSVPQVSEEGSVKEASVEVEDTAELNRAAQLPLFTPRRIVQTRDRRPRPARSGSTSSSRSWSGSATR